MINTNHSAEILFFSILIGVHLKGDQLPTWNVNSMFNPPVKLFLRVLCSIQPLSISTLFGLVRRVNYLRVIQMREEGVGLRFTRSISAQYWKHQTRLRKGFWGFQLCAERTSMAAIICILLSVETLFWYPDISPSSYQLTLHHHHYTVNLLQDNNCCKTIQHASCRVKCHLL